MIIQQKEIIMAEKKTVVKWWKVALVLIGLGLVTQIPGIGTAILWLIGAALSLFVGGFAVQYLLDYWGGKAMSFVMPKWVSYAIGFVTASIAVPLATLTFIFFDSKTLKEVLEGWSGSNKVGVFSLTWRVSRQVFLIYKKKFI